MWNLGRITTLDIANYLNLSEYQVNTIKSKMRERVVNFAPSVSGVVVYSLREAAAIEFVHIRKNEFNLDDACDLAVKALYMRNIPRVVK